MNWRPASPFDSVLADEQAALAGVENAKRELAKARKAHAASIKRMNEAEAQLTEVRLCAVQAQALGLYCGWQPPSPEDAAIAEDLVRKAGKLTKETRPGDVHPGWEVGCAVMRVCMRADWEDLAEMSGEGTRCFEERMRHDYARGMHRLLELASGKRCANPFFSKKSDYD